MPQNQRVNNAGRRLYLACLLVIGIVLSACQGALPAPSATAAAIPSRNGAIPSRNGAIPSRNGAIPSRTAAPSLMPGPTQDQPDTATAGPTVSATAGEKTVLTATATITPAPSSSPLTVGQVSVPAGKVIMPILLYHHVSDNAGATRYVTSLAAFRAQMQTLKQAGYQTITISQLAGVIRGGGSLPVKPIAITFDDGYLDTYQNAFPILRDLGFTATAYIITGTLGTDKSYGYMQDAALKELIAAGWEIGSHSVTHTSLMTSKLGMGNEMKQSKEDLEKKLGITIHSFSYPFGIANKSIEELPAQYGYDSAVGLDTLITHRPNRLFYLNRREVYRGITTQQFAALLLPGESDNLIATQAALTLTPKAP